MPRDSGRSRGRKREKSIATLICASACECVLWLCNTKVISNFRCCISFVVFHTLKFRVFVDFLLRLMSDLIARREDDDGNQRRRREKFRFLVVQIEDTRVSRALRFFFFLLFVHILPHCLVSRLSLSYRLLRRESYFFFFGFSVIGPSWTIDGARHCTSSTHGFFSFHRFLLPCRFVLLTTLEWDAIKMGMKLNCEREKQKYYMWEMRFHATTAKAHITTATIWEYERKRTLRELDKVARVRTWRVKWKWLDESSTEMNIVHRNELRWSVVDSGEILLAATRWENDVRPVTTTQLCKWNEI